MFGLMERQRADAIAACDRIQELCKQQQTACENILRIFDNTANGRDPNDGVKPIPQKPRERFVVGDQPCRQFLRGDADIAALGPDNRRNLHQCPVCSGHRAWCDACHSDHHDGGWETCKPGAYDYSDDDQ